MARKKLKWITKPFKPQNLNATLQSISSIGVLTLAIYAMFFSKFSQLIEVELRMDLIEAKQQLAEINKEFMGIKTVYNNLKEQKEYLESQIDKLKEENNNLSVEINNKIIQESALAERVKNLHDQRSQYLNLIVQDTVKKFETNTLNKLSLIDMHLNNAETFQEFTLYAEAIASDKLELGVTEFNGEPIPISWMLGILNMQYMQTEEITKNFHEGNSLNRDELTRKSYDFLVAQYKQNLYHPNIMLGNGESVPNYPLLGVELINNLTKDGMFSFIDTDEISPFTMKIKDFLKEHEMTLNKPINLTLKSKIFTAEELKTQTTDARLSFNKFNELFEQFISELKEFKIE